MDTKEYIEKQELQKQKELKEYLQSVENKKKDIKSFVKRTIATGLVFGSILTGTACGIKNPNNQTTTNPNQTTTLDTTTSTIGTDTTGTTTPTETTTSGQTETTTSTETTITPPIVDKKQETINKFLTLLDEMAERNGVDEIRDIMLFQKKPELATSDYFQLSFGAVDNMTYNDILEYYILTEEEYKSILSSINYNFIPNYTYHLSNEKLLSRDKSAKSIDIINNSIETKERYNEDNPYKYEIDYEKKKEKDLAEFNEFLAKVSAEHGGKEVSSIRFIKDGKGFNSMILFYKELEHFEINLRTYALKDEWYETISEKLFGEEQYKSITIDELIKNYDSDVFDCILESIHTYKPVINPKTMDEKER